MLGLESLPAVLYFAFLFAVPESPRWLIMKERVDEARKTLLKVVNEEQAEMDIIAVKESLISETGKSKAPLSALFRPALRLVLLIGITVAIVQQITGINSVFFYAPMIFEQTGIGTDAAFSQAILVGLTNLVFTILAILFIDRFGRKVLLLFGLSGIAISMFLLAYGFSMDEASMNPWLILIGIIGFVASFAISIGPVMWVLFSEIFPNSVRGIAISFVGLINSAVSFLVQLVFPWELDTIGSSATFLIYGAFAVIGLVIIAILLPETKGKSLEELEKQLIKQ
jgi:sugar porter (SP) family MFS transporter